MQGSVWSMLSYSVKCQEVATVLHACNIFFVTLCHKKKKTIPKNMFNLNIESTVTFKWHKLNSLAGSAEVRVPKREKRVNKEIINYRNNSGVQRFCLFPGVWGKRGDKLSIIHRLNRLALSIPRPSSSFSLWKTEKRCSAKLSPLCRNHFISCPRQFRPGLWIFLAHRVGQMISHGATPF